jgi:hypothetical protein
MGWCAALDARHMSMIHISTARLRAAKIGLTIEVHGSRAVFFRDKSVIGSTAITGEYVSERATEAILTPVKAHKDKGK